MRTMCLIAGAFFLFTAVACTSTSVKLPSAAVGPNEKVIGPSEGSSTGIMLMGFIPILQNTRFQDAYAEAVQKSGGTRLTDITISEQWFWALILNGYTFNVHGTAVGNK